jgi:Flp pilus assembly protein TadG
MLIRDKKGQAMVEFAIVFPLQIFVTLIILQLVFLYVATHVVNFAAFAAARAELVGEDPEAAAEAICTPIAGITDIAGMPEPISYPGWGTLDRSDISQERTSVNIVTPLSADQNIVEVSVSCDVEMIFPVANQIVPWIPLMPDEQYGEIDGVPHLTIVASHQLPVSWR